MEDFLLKIINMSITAGWLILAVLVLRLCLRKAPRWIVCWLWGLVAFRLLCPVSLESVFSLIPSREPVRQESAVLQAPSVDSGLTFVDDRVNPVLRNVFTPSAAESVSHPGAWPAAACMVWAVGVLAFLGYAVFGFVRLHRKVRTAVRLRENIYQSEFVATPFVMGIVSPRIYLPFHMEEEVMEFVIAHEKAHLKRGDHRWKLLAYLLLAFYWFQPLCWVACAMFSKDIELACDEKVIRAYDAAQKKKYSEALLICSQGKAFKAAYPLAFGEVGVRERIRAVLQYKKPAFWVILAAAAACIVAAVCFLTDPVERDEVSDGKENTSAADHSRESDEDAVEGNAVAGSESAPADSGQSSDAEAADASGRLQDMLEQWKRAFVHLDQGTIAALASPEALAQMEAEGILFAADDGYQFGDHVPWPEDETADAQLWGWDDSQGQIYYYVWDDGPFVTVWRETLSYEMRGGSWVVTEESLKRYDQISSWQEYLEASRGMISGTPLDYLQNGRGEALNSNALLSSSWKYRDLFSPESAARRLLNLSDDVEKVRIERTSEEGNMTGLEISFAGTGEQARITMVQAYGDGGDHAGIWIPQDLQTNVVYRMMQADWEEVSRRTRGVDSYTGQTDIVCIGEIPDHNIRIYGYNDREITGKGVAVERGDRRDYYDWVYTSPQTILPDCYWNEEKEQLQIALRIYTGTGVSAQSLHVLQYGENSEPVDNEFDLGDYEDILQNRIGYTCDESTGILTITDRQYGETLAEVKVTEEMSEQAGGITGIEAGEISGFVLGDTVSLQIGLGCFSENYAIAWYENMPTVEAEVLMEQTGEGIRFDLGRLKVIEAAQ